MTRVIARQAVLTNDGLYRLKLGRKMATGRKVGLWLGVNPSTADAELDDASIRKLYGFGERLDIGEWWVGNMFAYRATDVRTLARIQDPIGSATDVYLAQMMDAADVVIAGWGSIGKVPLRLQGRWRDLVLLADERGKELMCWGTCGDGHPRHPLMLAYDTPLVPWEVPE